MNAHSPLIELTSKNRTKTEFKREDKSQAKCKESDDSEDTIEGQLLLLQYL